jgi:hypothetical protein
MIIKYWQAMAGLSIAVSVVMESIGYYAPVVPVGVLIGGLALAGYIRRIEKGKALSLQKR